MKVLSLFDGVWKMNTLIRYIIARYYLRQYAKKNTVKRRAIMKVSGSGTYYVLIKIRGHKGWRDRVRVANHPRRNRRGNIKSQMLTGQLEHDIIVKGLKIMHYKKKSNK